MNLEHYPLITHPGNYRLVTDRNGDFYRLPLNYPPPDGYSLVEKSDRFYDESGRLLPKHWARERLRP